MYFWRALPCPTHISLSVFAAKNMTREDSLVPVFLGSICLFVKSVAVKRLVCV